MEKNILNQKKWKIIKKLLTFRYGYDIITESAAKGNSSMAEQRSPKPLMGVRIPLPLLLKASVIQRWVIGVFCFFKHSSRTSMRLGAWFWSEKLTYSYQNHCASSRSVYLSRRPNSHWDKFAITHHLKDATEKVLILRKVAQDKVYLYVLRYYILYAKTVFQWRPSGGE